MMVNTVFKTYLKNCLTVAIWNYDWDMDIETGNRGSPTVNKTNRFWSLAVRCTSSVAEFQAIGGLNIPF